MDGEKNFREITEKGERYALLIDGNTVPEGLQFYTGNEAFVQVASWKYQKGHVTVPHSHNVCERTSTITQEFVIVKKGAMEVTLFNMQEKAFTKETLKQGMALLIFKGGHAYHILEDGTEVFEIKNGPYLGIEKDKNVLQNPKNGGY